mmetsp:Transcript_1802/g.7222  ORF Transcript_1802/g.7222 Transcript_1802/m.7222 type:complete len:387 (-) Transcript_1802:1630-2790(-)
MVSEGDGARAPFATQRSVAPFPRSPSRNEHGIVGCARTSTREARTLPSSLAVTSHAPLVLREACGASSISQLCASRPCPSGNNVRRGIESGPHARARGGRVRCTCTLPPRRKAKARRTAGSSPPALRGSNLRPPRRPAETCMSYGRFQPPHVTRVISRLPSTHTAIHSSPRKPQASSSSTCPTEERSPLASTSFACSGTKACSDVIVCRRRERTGRSVSMPSLAASAAMRSYHTVRPSRPADIAAPPGRSRTKDTLSLAWACDRIIEGDSVVAPLEILSSEADAVAEVGPAGNLKMKTLPRWSPQMSSLPSFETSQQCVRMVEGTAIVHRSAATVESAVLLTSAPARASDMLEEWRSHSFMTPTPSAVRSAWPPNDAGHTIDTTSF